MSNHHVFRRTLLKAGGLLGTGTAGLLHLGSALAKTAAGKAGAAARPAALANFKGEIITRSDSRYLGWFWAMSWYRIKPSTFPSMFARPTSREDLALLMAYANQTKELLKYAGTCRQSRHSNRRFKGLQVYGTMSPGNSKDPVYFLVLLEQDLRFFSCVATSVLRSTSLNCCVV